MISMNIMEIGAHILSNLSNESRKSNKMQGLSSILLIFATNFILNALKQEFYLSYDINQNYFEIAFSG